MLPGWLSSDVAKNHRGESGDPKQLERAFPKADPPGEGLQLSLRYAVAARLGQFFSTPSKMGKAPITNIAIAR